jgi:hypothetical protein
MLSHKINCVGGNKFSLNKGLRYQLGIVLVLDRLE